MDEVAQLLSKDMVLFIKVTVGLINDSSHSALQNIMEELVELEELYESHRKPASFFIYGFRREL